MTLKKIIRRLLNLLRIVFAPKWKLSLDEYSKLRALRFFSEKDVDSAIDVFYDSPLRDCPRAYVGDNTIIVPAQAVKFFQETQLEFKDTRVLSSSELSPEERSKLWAGSLTAL